MHYLNLLVLNQAGLEIPQAQSRKALVMPALTQSWCPEHVSRRD